MRLLRTKNLYLVCSFLTLCLSGFAQQPSFQKTYTGEHSEIPTSLKQTQDGGYVMLGRSQVSIPDTIDPETGIRLVRLERDGSIRWTKCYGGSKVDFGHDVIETLDGGFLIAGQTENTGDQHRYAYLIKTDSLGGKQWAKVYTDMDGTFHSLTRTKDNQYLAVGSGPQHLFAVKLDVRATNIWTQRYELKNIMRNPLVKTCETSGNEGFAIAGTVDDNFVLLRISDEGKPFWFKTYKNIHRAACTSLAETYDGGFLLSGNVFKSNDNGNAKINIVKTQKDGRVEWSNIYGSMKGRDMVVSSTTLGNGELALGIHTSGYSQDIQMAVMLLQKEGIPRKTFLLGAKNKRDEGTQIMFTKDRGIAYLGRTDGFQVKRPSYYLVKMDIYGRSGVNPENVRLQVRSLKTESEDQKITLLPARFHRDIKFRDCPTEVVASVLEEKLICGNVEAAFNPQKVIQARARARDSMALVALFESTNGKQWSSRWDLRAPMSAWESIELDQDGRVMKVMLISNRLSGSLPPEIGNLSKLRILWLAHNELNGTLPSELGKLKYLEELLLDHNKLSGNIPAELAKMEELRRLRLDHNQLMGSIPIEFASFTKLEEFRLNDNQLNGELPPGFTLPMTAQLDLSNNEFTGSIPKAIINLDNARMKNNQFVPHAKAKLEGLMAGKYTYADASGESYSLVLYDDTQRFTLMQTMLDEDDGWVYVVVKGKFEWNEKGVFLHGELLERGIMGDSSSNKKTTMEAYKEKHTLEFVEIPEGAGQVKVKLRAFDTELKLEKETSK